MGAEYFDHYVVTTDEAKDVFDELVKQAGWDFGHAGYTGTIAEKDDYIMITPPVPLPNVDAVLEWALACTDPTSEHYDPRVADKWGPAGCIKVVNDGFLFFGWASS